MVRILVRLLMALSVIVLPLVLAYALFPVVAPGLIARQAVSLGIETRDIRLQRPTLNGLQVDHVSAVGADLSMELTGMQLSWNPASLRRGRLLRIDVASASLIVNTGTADQHGEAGPALTAADSAGGLFGSLPFEAARIESLTVSLPALSFAARGQLDFAADRLALRLEGLAPDAAQGLVLEAGLSGGGGIELALAGAGGEGMPFLSILTNLPRDRLDLAFDANLRGFVLDLAATLAGLPRGSGQVSARGSLSLPWPPTEDAWRTLTASTPLRADWQSADGRFSLIGLQGRLTAGNGELLAALTGEATVTGKGSRIAIRPSEVRLTAQPLRIAGHGDVDILTKDVRLTGTGSGSVSTRAISGYDLAAELDGTLVRETLRLPLRLGGKGVLDGTTLSAGMQVTSGPLRAFPLDVRYDADRQQTEIRADHPVTFSKPFLRSFLPDWPVDYDLDAGTVRVTMDLAGGAATGLSGRGSFALDRVAAHAGPAAIRGLSGIVTLRLGNSGRMTIDSNRLRASLVDFGVPLREVEVTLAGDPSELEVGHASFELLGGRATAVPFRLRPADGTAQTLVTLEDLDLAQVLALEGDHITGSGRLDGTLPIRWAGGAFSIPGGRIAARPPGGEIRLQPAIARAVTQPGLDVALAALTNFHYSLLESAVDYSQAGDLALGVRLEGRNPDVERGRPVHFNLNVSENIPTLLRSLRLQDEFTERIERRVQR